MLRPYVSRRWRALAGAGGATVVLTVAELAKPWPLALVVDRLLAHRTAPFELDGADVRLLVLVAALMLAIALAEALAQYASDLWLQRAGERITHDLRVRVYDHLQRLSLGFHQRRQKGDLVTRVTGDVNAMGDLFSQSLGEIVQAALLAVGMTVVLLVIDPVLALVVARPAPLMVALSFVYRRRVRTQARRAARAGGRDRVRRQRGAVGDGGREGVRLRGLRERARARAQRAAAGGRRRGRAAAGALRRAGRPVRAIGTALVLVVGVAPGLARRDLAGRAARVRLLHAQGAQPDAQHRPRGDEGRGGDGAGRPDRRAAGRRRGAPGAAGRLPRRRAPRATSRSRACRSPTAPRGRRCATSRCASRRGSGSR